MKLSATVKYYNDVTEETCKKKKKLQSMVGH